MKIPTPTLYFPAVIDFGSNQAFFPHVRAETYLGDKEIIGVQFLSGSDLPKIIHLLSKKLSRLIAVEMFNKRIPEPKSDFDLESIKLREGQKTVMIPIHIKAELHKLLGKPIRKTVTIPFLLDHFAKQHNLNFSQLLSDAIRDRMNSREGNGKDAK